MRSRHIIQKKEEVSGQELGKVSAKCSQGPGKQKYFLIHEKKKIAGVPPDSLPRNPKW